MIRILLIARPVVPKRAAPGGTGALHKVSFGKMQRKPRIF